MRHDLYHISITYPCCKSPIDPQGVKCTVIINNQREWYSILNTFGLLFVCPSRVAINKSKFGMA